MADLNTSRHALPYLAVAQAQKEITHNEALALIDALLHPVVQGQVSTPPSVSNADLGKCWLVSSDASGIWTGREGQISLWTGGSWRFLVPVLGMRIRNAAYNFDYVWTGSAWLAAPNVANPQSGNVVDEEARAAINTLLAHFRMIGLLVA